MLIRAFASLLRYQQPQCVRSLPMPIFSMSEGSSELRRDDYTQPGQSKEKPLPPRPSGRGQAFGLARSTEALHANKKKTCNGIASPLPINVPPPRGQRTGSGLYIVSP